MHKDRFGYTLFLSISFHLIILIGLSLEITQRKVDYLGAYLYLDHVINPVSFIKKILEYSNSVGFILERSNTGVPVQHFTGWNINSIKYLAKIFKKKINYSFAPIKKTGKDFFLLY